MHTFIYRFSSLFSLFFTYSCTTFKDKQLERVGSDDSIVMVANSINRFCYLAKRPQFLADVSAQSMSIPPFEMEGVWQNSFDLLKANVIGPLGEEYLSFSIDKNQFAYNGASENEVVASNFEQISSLLSSIGAKGLRGFLCGGYAFQNKEKNDGLYNVKDVEKGNQLSNNSANENNGKKYFSISSVEISGHNVEVQSNLILSKKGQGNGLVINSRFFYGPFSQDAKIEVKWVGFITEKAIYPTTTIFRVGAETYSVKFSDYQ